MSFPGGWMALAGGRDDPAAGYNLQAQPRTQREGSAMTILTDILRVSTWPEPIPYRPLWGLGFLGLHPTPPFAISHSQPTITLE